MHVAVFQPEYRGFAGHTHQEALGWMDACANAGAHLALFSHRGILRSAAAETGAIACFGVTEDDFRRFSYPESAPNGASDSAFGLADFLVQSRAHARGCAEAWTQLPDGADLVIVPWATAALLNGVAEWLNDVPAAARPTVAANIIMPEPSWRVDRESVSAKGEFAYLRLAARRLRSLCASGFLLTSIDQRLAQLVHAVTAIPCALSPLPQFYGGFGEAGPPSHGPTIGLLGMPRDEKGSGVWVDLISKVAQRRAGVGFTVHARSSGQAASFAQSLAPLPPSTKVTIWPAPISRADYVTSLRSCDLVVLPYEPQAYAMRASGIFADALAMARPVVAPDRTWLSDRLAEGWGAGEVFDPSDPSGLLNAVERALQRLDELRTASMTTYKRWRDTQSVRAYIHQILQWRATRAD